MTRKVQPNANLGAGTLAESQVIENLHGLHECCLSALSCSAFLDICLPSHDRFAFARDRLLELLFELRNRIADVLQVDGRAHLQDLEWLCEPLPTSSQTAYVLARVGDPKSEYYMAIKLVYEIGCEIIDGVLSDSVRPLVGLTAEKQREIENAVSHQISNSLAIISLVTEEVALTDKDKELLEAMRLLKLSSDKCASREQILQMAKWESEGKRAFKRLMSAGYVKSKRGVGYYLTTAGIAKAEKLSERT